MNIKNIFKKYKIIIFLAFLVFVLGFIKIYFQNKNVYDNDLSSVKKTGEININKEYQDKISVDNKNKEELDIKSPVVSLREKETSDDIKPSNELIKEYEELETTEEYLSFLDKLTEEEQEYFSFEELPNEYCLGDYFPYETDTFLIRGYLSENIISVVAKGDNLDTSKKDLRSWLRENECERDRHIIVWED